MNGFRCILPWIHIATQVSGATRPCCITGFSNNTTFKTSTDDSKSTLQSVTNLKHHSLDEILNSQTARELREEMNRGLVPKPCQICKFNEEEFGESKRLQENRKWQSDFAQLPMTPKLKYVDLRFGNTCNLKCVMCSAKESSSWRADYMGLAAKVESPRLKNYLHALHYEEAEPFGESNWYDIESPFWTDFFARLQDIQEIYFAGGEPLIQKEHQWCLKQIISRGFAGQIRLRYNTNLSYLNEAHFEMWSHFQKVDISVSLDSLERKNEFIRYPSRWTILEKNLQQLDQSNKNINFSFSFTVQALNILDVTQFIDWKSKQNFKKSKDDPTLSNISFNLLHTPHFLNARILPAPMKTLARDRLFKISEVERDRRLFDLAIHMDKEDWSIYWPEFREYIRNLSDLRKQDFVAIFPDFVEYFV